MTTDDESAGWSAPDLDRIGAAEERGIATVRADGSLRALVADRPPPPLTAPEL